MSKATYSISGDSGANFCKTFKAFYNFHQILMANEMNYNSLCLYE